MSTHVSTKDRPGEYDAFETAKPDEPIFGLQGGDPLAALTVMFWAWKARQFARKLGRKKDREHLLRKASAAEEVAWAMRDYRNGQAVVPGERVSYSEDAAPVSVEQANAAKVRGALIESVGHLRNAVGIAKEVEEALGKLRLHKPERDAILKAIEQLQAVAAAIEPRREGERS